MINGDGFFVVQERRHDRVHPRRCVPPRQAGHLVTPDGAIAAGHRRREPRPVGLLVSRHVRVVEHRANGDVNAVDAAGATTTLGTIGLATFANPNGLFRVGDTSYVASAELGRRLGGHPGHRRLGNLTPGYVEMSNVDLSTELTNLIIAERGFQANSRGHHAPPTRSCRRSST